MGYKKVYYDDIWEITSNCAKKSRSWQEDLIKVNNSISQFQSSNALKGNAADSLNSYMSEVYGTLVCVIGSILQTFESQAESYYKGYFNAVDSGDGKKGGRYTTIVYSEVNPYGSIENRLKTISRKVNETSSEANKVKNSISHLVKISAYPKTSSINNSVNDAIKIALRLNEKVNNYEASRTNDFVEIDNLIEQAKKIINSQLGKSRIPVIEYQSGSVNNMCDLDEINVNLEAANKIVTDFQNSKDYKEAVNLAINRDAILEEQAKEDRQWVQWAVVGVAVVGGIITTVVTLGTAGPGACVLVGAAVGAATAATSCIADNYVENGTLFEGMDWSNFGKEVLVGAAVGGGTGYFSSVSSGSAIKQPIKAATRALYENTVKEGIEGTVRIAWDVGDAFINQKPGNYVQSVLKDDVDSLLRGVFVEGAEEFVGGYVGGKFNIDTSDKKFAQRFKESTVENAAKNVAGGVFDTAIDIGEGVVCSDSSKKVSSILWDNSKKRVSEFIGDTAGDLVTDGFKGADNIKKSKFVKTGAQTVRDTVSDVVKDGADTVTGRTLDYLDGTEKDAGKIFDLDDLKENGQKYGAKYAKKFVDNGFKNATKNSDRKTYSDMKKVSYENEQGERVVDVVEVGDYAYTKEDYDAAKNNAGKGAYKDKTVQDILGMSKDTDLSKAQNKTVSIDNIEKYSSKSTRKTTDTVSIKNGNETYTYKKDYYDSAVNAAGKGDYKNKTVQDILGISNDVDVSEDNVTYKRINNDKIGVDKQVSLTQDDTSAAKKIKINEKTDNSKSKAKATDILK